MQYIHSIRGELSNPIEPTKGYIAPDCGRRPPIARRDDLRMPTDAPASKNRSVFALDAFGRLRAFNFAADPKFSKLFGRREFFKLNRKIQPFAFYEFFGRDAISKFLRISRRPL